MRAVIIRAWRPGDPWRERAHEYAARWWEKLGYEIVEVEHPGPEPFNRSWALNEGARRAWPWDVAMFIDSDVLEDQDGQVHEAIHRAYETNKFVVAHTAGKDITREGTERIYAGESFDWNTELAAVRKVCDSRVNAISAKLFEMVGGFDARFRGWGHEDVAFFDVCVTAAGPVERIPGNSWHLWHENALAESRVTADWKAGEQRMQRVKLAKRSGWGAVKAILDERTDDEKWTRPKVSRPPAQTRPRAGTDIIIPTSGRREFLAEAILSAERHLHGNIARRIIVDDSGDKSFARWLESNAASWEVLRHSSENEGFTLTIAATWEYLAATPGAPYVFWLEDDFVFERDVEIDDLATVLEGADPPLAQIVLLRAPYYRVEKEAGSIPNERPDAYTRREVNGLPYLEHIEFFSTNPNLMRRDSLAIGYPMTKNSEQVIGTKFLITGKRFAWYGSGEPWIRHIGSYRNGKGY